MRFVLRLLVVLVVVVLLIQLIPYGRDHTNPRGGREPEWSSPAVRQLTQRGCFDCHSNLTEWPWYTNVAPVSWLAQHDVDGGRDVLNFSEWQKPQDAGLQDVIEAIRGEDMPPAEYRLLHKEARLTDNEKQVLEAGLTSTWAKDPPGSKDGG